MARSDDPARVGYDIGHVEYPVERPARRVPVAASRTYVIRCQAPRQVIEGLGFEIQSDTIASGNASLPANTGGMPFELVPAERQRLYREMLRGFRWCRVAGGLYWRGLDAGQGQLRERWSGQLAGLSELVRESGVEGISFEYWSPAPLWKANRSFVGRDGTPCVLRCFGPDFDSDPLYQGDVDRFLRDFAAACVEDLRHICQAGIPVVMWGLQNEPYVVSSYSSCCYTPEQWSRTFRAVAPAIRAFDPGIRIIGDTWDLRCVAQAVADDPASTSLIDSLVLHHVGSDAAVVRPRCENGVLRGLAHLPRFQNEYEYLVGPGSPARCLNTVCHILNWFQIGEAPAWFWIHAVKPMGNLEASAYALGRWTSPDATPAAGVPPPGHWAFNPFNWHAVGSFVRHLPWNSQVVSIDEIERDEDLRSLAFLRPDGRLTVVVANRSGCPHTFALETGRAGSFSGWRYTPDQSGSDCLGVAIGSRHGEDLAPTVADLSWEFWVEDP